ncbi:MAG: hypothetical protein LBL21_00460 [Rickettsiales bacterium]|jgi:hypothetical protein|nr:hypothetical protein [Rickettsiales bacterium]
MKGSTELLAKDLDAKNLRKIEAAFAAGRVDGAARDYLETLYADSMGCFRYNFYFLGRALGAPKTPIYRYDPKTDEAENKELQISGVGPFDTYLVYHRFDSDPMRNQFFTFEGGTDTRLFVSSIVGAIVAAQKNVARAIDKITGKYYDDYLDEVLGVVAAVLAKHRKSASVQAVSDKITDGFRRRFVSSPAPEVLKIIGNLFPDISVDMVRGLDRVAPPHARLNDVWRMKLLFDAVPQINAFIDYVERQMPYRILSVKNSFYELGNDRDYRDAKIIVGFEFAGAVIPLEIICNVRTFFGFERQSHAGYESIRKDLGADAKEVGALHHSGIVEYNKIVCSCVSYLLHRVGWNIMYEKDLDINSFFSGFPEIERLPYSQRIVDAIIEKMDNSVRNEVFRIPYAPRPLSEEEELSVFRYITRFVLFSALPYSYKYEEIKNGGFSGRLFNFVMKELYRYYENDAL